MKGRQTVLIGIGIGIGIAVLLLLSFLMGFYLGTKKTGTFPFWERRFIAPFGFVPNRFGHGVVGTIDSLGENTIVVKDRSGALKTVLIEKNTVLRRNGTEIKFSDLEEGERVIVLGEPEEKEGVIKARVVRIITKFSAPAGGRLPKL